MNAPSERLNGHALGVMQTVLQLGPTQVKLIWTGQDGTYLGEIVYTAASVEALKTMAEGFARFVAQNTSGIIVPPSAGVPAAKLS